MADQVSGAQVAAKQSATGNLTNTTVVVQQNSLAKLPFSPSFADHTIEGKMLEYTEGDVLRFTATSGKMRTITMNTPRSSHPVYFDFYKCEDADGYNYTTVRMGDQLWMAEDLRVKQVDGATKIADVSAWTKTEIKTARGSPTSR